MNSYRFFSQNITRFLYLIMVLAAGGLLYGILNLQDNQKKLEIAHNEQFMTAQANHFKEQYLLKLTRQIAQADTIENLDVYAEKPDVLNFQLSPPGLDSAFTIDPSLSNSSHYGLIKQVKTQLNSSLNDGYHLIPFQNKTYLAFSYTDSLNKTRWLNILIQPLDSITSQLTLGSAETSAWLVNDTSYYAPRGNNCQEDGLQMLLLSSDNNHFFSCRESGIKRDYYLVKLALDENLAWVSIFSMDKPQKGIRLLLLICTLLLFGSFAAIPFLSRGQFLHQIRKINDVINRLSEKDFDTILPDDFQGEVGVLARSVNSMRKQLKEIYENLEIRVIRRTSEISLRNAELRKKQREILKQNHELKSAYEALKESREKYEKLIENLEDEYFFYSKYTDGSLLFVSNSVKKILGYDKKNYRQIHDKIYTEDSINKLAREKEENLRSGKNEPKFLKVVLDANQQEKYLEVSEVPVFNELGQLVSIEGLAHDITEQRKADETIKEQEEKYRMLFTHASDFIMMYEINLQKKVIGNFIEANDYALEKLGYTLAELRSMTPESIIAAEIWNRDEDLPFEFAQSEDTFERIWEAKNGKIIDVEISAHAFRIRDKSVVIVVARDISERKRAEEEIRFVNEELVNQKENLEAMIDNLTQTQEQLVQSEKMAALGQLIAGIAHEINTPLGAIKASIGNLSDSLDTALGELPELFQTQSVDDLKLFTHIFTLAQGKKPELSSREKRQIRRDLTTLLQEEGIDSAQLLADTLVYLDIYQEPTQTLIPSLKRPNALQVIRSARNFISLMKNTNTINIAVEKATKVVFALKKYAHRDAGGEMVETDLIDSIETVLTLYNNQLKQGVEIIREYGEIPLIRCLHDEISQVWTNLVHNAIQAMRQEGSITITTHFKDNYIYVMFKDTGPGIEPDIIDRIFEPFFTTKKQGEGSGLGLDIVKKIIEKHNGTITVESKIGEGAKFIIKLPVE